MLVQSNVLKCWESIGVKSSCIAASLLLSTTSATTPGPNDDLLDFKTTHGKVGNGITDESYSAHLPSFSTLPVEVKFGWCVMPSSVGSV